MPACCDGPLVHLAFIHGATEHKAAQIPRPACALTTHYLRWSYLIFGLNPEDKESAA
jgi:hypothetical protein